MINKKGIKNQCVYAYIWTSSLIHEFIACVLACNKHKNYLISLLTNQMLIVNSVVMRLYTRHCKSSGIKYAVR